MRKAPLEGILQQIGSNYAHFVARKPWIFVIVPLIVTVILSTGLTKFHIRRGVHVLYSPVDAPWKTEEDTIREMWVNHDDRFYPGKDIILRNGIFFIITSKNNSNVLEKNVCDQMITLLDSVVNMKFISKDGKEYKYSDICLRFQNECFQNTQVKVLADIYSKRDQSFINVTYPMFSSKYLPEPIDLRSVLGGVTKDKNKGRLTEAKAWILAYQLKQESEELREFSSEFVHQLPLKIEALNFSLIDIFHFHSETFDDELARNALRMVPKFSITFTILVVFSIVCTFNLMETEEGLFLDWVRSKPLMGVVGVVATLMAIVSAVGLLLLFDVTFVEMCSVMPFLSLTIGIDDSFLMLASWHSTDPMAKVEDRLAKCLSHAASSITITSITDTIAFLIGSIAPLPAVEYFCYYSCVAIMFIYIYTMTLFSACLAIQGKWEEEKRNSLFYCKVTEYNKDLPTLTKLFNLGRMEKEEISKKIWYENLFGHKFGPILIKPWIQIIVALFYVVYISFVSLGIYNIKVGFDVANIVTENPNAARFIALRTEYFPTDASQFDVLVLTAPNMGNKTERENFLGTLDQFESNECSKSREFTDFWFFKYRDYLAEMGFEFDEDLDVDSETFQENLTPFLMASDKYAHDVIQDKAFRLSVELKKFENEKSILYCANLIRSIANNNSNYNITTFTPIWNLADQLDVIWPQTMQDLYISVGVMVIVALLFMPDLKCGFVVGISILSVGFGVLGFMTFWGVKLDATSMITIAMSVGFSVDFAAHIVYAFNEHEVHTAKGETKDKETTPLIDPDDRLIRALGSVGWPICQGTLSVFLGVIVLGTIKSYIVQTCFKTVFLVITFGIIHALIFIPVFLHFIYKTENKFLKRKSTNSKS